MSYRTLANLFAHATCSPLPPGGRKKGREGGREGGGGKRAREIVSNHPSRYACVRVTLCVTDCEVVPTVRLRIRRPPDAIRRRPQGAGASAYADSTYYRATTVCVFITAVPITKLFAWGEGIVEDMCYERRRAEALED